MHFAQQKISNYQVVPPIAQNLLFKLRTQFNMNRKSVKKWDIGIPENGNRG